MTLRSVGLAYRQLSASLAKDWARVAALDATHYALDATFSPRWAPPDPRFGQSLSDALDALSVLESVGRNVLGARGCINGATRCPPEWVRNCDACTIVEGTV